jgi:peptide/nickel transport system substrate-binding protein
VANACETPGSDAKHYDGTINLGLVLEPTSLDFTTQSGAQAPQLLLGNVYQTLVWQNPDGELAPCLAKSWTVSDDGKTYTFEIEPDVTFSDGSPFTADDAAFTINYVKDKWTNGVKKYMDVVDSATAVSPSELKVVLKQPSNLWLYKMASRVGAMMSPKHVDKLATEAIGTGPYTLGTWKHGDSITLNRADKYWGAPAPVKTVVFKYFQDPTAMNNAFLTGGIQVITTVQTPQVLAQFQNNPKYVIIDGTTTGKVMMAINNAKPPLNDLKVRQAINYALDKDALLKGAWAGYGTVIGSHEVPTDPWYVDLNDKYPHDVAKAKQLLADAGQSNLKLTLQLPPVPYAAAAAPIIKSQLAQAGITVDVSNVTWDNWLAHIFGKPYNYDLTIVNHVEAFDVTNVFSGKADYYTQYVNPKITQLEQEGDAGDHATFIKDFQQVVTTLADDAAAVWLWAFPNLMVVDANVHGLPKNAITEGLYVYQLTVS